MECRKKGENKRFFGAILVYSQMAGSEGTAVTGDMRSGNMIFEPILEDGVFRFDCSTNDRNAAFPRVSFVNPVDRETPTFNGHRVPSYIPTFECVLGQQIVNIEVNYILQSFCKFAFSSVLSCDNHVNYPKNIKDDPSESFRDLVSTWYVFLWNRRG